ncbi:hypothetical protein XpopCFBP1817_05775 [Xanthomonas populi]|uniref:Uncharacterized protein n=1 Tax=Xanthomonas populi TaxID=53414 RepID=A0A2S7EVI7_9XANT|nr:hypothetical protein XpopCFBP1817_05775 [Xanthomonas populi]
MGTILQALISVEDTKVIMSIHLEIPEDLIREFIQLYRLRKCQVQAKYGVVLMPPLQPLGYLVWKPAGV